MKNTFVGQKVIVLSGSLAEKTGTVTFQREDGAVMVEIDGQKECYAPETVGLPRIDSTAPAGVVKLAYQYNQSTRFIQDQNMAFLQSEGYFETSRSTIERNTFGEWLDLATAREAYRATEPFQKGDLGYGL